MSNIVVGTELEREVSHVVCRNFNLNVNVLSWTIHISNGTSRKLPARSLMLLDSGIKGVTTEATLSSILEMLVLYKEA